MGTESEVAVLIIGGGPVGLTAACELARYGIEFRCVDKREAPVVHSHASVVHVRTQEVFHAMGCSDGFLKNGYLYADQVFYAFGKRLGEMKLNGVDSPFDGPRDIWQSTTERLLIEHLQSFGKTVERPVEAIDYREEDRFAFVTLRKASGEVEQVRAQWVISAEGSHSLVREALSIPFEGPRYENQEFLQTDAHVEWSFPSGAGHAFIDHDRFVGFFPFDDKGFYRVLCARRQEGAVRHEAPTLEEMQRIVRESVDPQAVLSNPAWLNLFHAQRKKADCFHKGRAFLAGDSGHVHVPVGGQGMNTGIQDAFNLCWKLAYVIKGLAQPGLIETYNAERHPVAEHLLKFTDSGFNTLAHPDRWQSLLISSLGGVLLNSSAMQNKIRETLEEVGINYRGGPLAEGPLSSRAAPGDRAPTATLVRGRERQNATLLDVIRGTSWTLLGFVADSDLSRVEAALGSVSKEFEQVICSWLVLAERPQTGWPKGLPFLVDRGSALHKKYNIHGPTMVLIRPDWYIACRSDLGNQTAIRSFLGRWLHPSK